jgi:hypothetical protein
MAEVLVRDEQPRDIWAQHAAILAAVAAQAEAFVRVARGGAAHAPGAADLVRVNCGESRLVLGPLY